MISTIILKTERYQRKILKPNILNKFLKLMLSTIILKLKAINENFLKLNVINNNFLN